MKKITLVFRSALILALVAVAFMACQKESALVGGDTPTIVVENESAVDRSGFQCSYGVFPAGNVVKAFPTPGPQITLASVVAGLPAGSFVVVLDATNPAATEAWHNPTGIRAWAMSHPSRQVVVIYTAESNPGTAVQRWPRCGRGTPTTLVLQQSTTILQRIWNGKMAIMGQLGGYWADRFYVDDLSNSVAANMGQFALYGVCTSGQLQPIGNEGSCDWVSIMNDF